MLSDEDLLARAQHGDGEAFAEFYRRHVGPITTFARRRVGTPELAFDVAAETFAAAAEGLHGFDAVRGSARGWLFGIAHNELRMMWRRGVVEDRARRRLALEPIVIDDDDVRWIEQIVDDGVLVEALAGLPADQRDAISARVIEERDYQDIARELRCSESVIRKRVSRGLRRIRQEVRP